MSKSIPIGKYKFVISRSFLQDITYLMSFWNDFKYQSYCFSTIQFGLFYPFKGK